MSSDDEDYDPGSEDDSEPSSSFSDGGVRTRRCRRSVESPRRRSFYVSSDSEVTSDGTADEAPPPKHSRTGPIGKEETAKGEDDEEKDDGYESDMCYVCRDGGDLICCDACPHVWHIGCCVPPLDSPPEGKWLCPVCSGVPVVQMVFCDVCDKQCIEAGSFLTCFDCGKSFHSSCLPKRSIMSSLPCRTPTPAAATSTTGCGSEKSWLCPQCMQHQCEVCRGLVDKSDRLDCSVCRLHFHDYCVDFKPSRKQPSFVCTDCATGKRVQMILGHRWEKSQSNKSGASPSPIPRELEYFVKWTTLSHIHNSWVPEAKLDARSPQLLHNYKRKRCLEDNPSLIGETEDTDLMKAEWTQVDRVISHEGSGATTSYLVKWCGLGYEAATWETAADIADFPDEIDRYRRVNDYEAFKALPERRGPNPKSFEEMKEQPQYIPLELFDYQREGCSWIHFSWNKRRNVILADEMGLGKTITTIAFLSTLRHEQNIHGPFLVIAPLSTVTNWEREFKLWAPECNVVCYVGNSDARDTARKHELYFGASSKRNSSAAGYHTKFDVLLTSYDIALVDASLLRKFSWEAIVVDEGHRLKNRKSKLFEALHPLRSNFRMLLSGTPLQNDLKELFNMLKFLQVDGFEDPDAVYAAEYASLSEEAVVQRLHDTIRPHMLRRLKGDVVRGLPGKAEYVVPVDPTPLQKQYYRAVLSHNYEFLRRGNAGKKANFINILSSLQKVCNHPYLIPGAEPLGLPAEEESRRLIEASGKLVLVDKMLAKLKQQGHRVLLFSQQTTLLDIVEEFLRGRGYVFGRIDGKTKSVDRQRAVDEFNRAESPVFVMLLSTRAGGLGINLATADTVIIYDSDWNPHNDVQALSRAHRIGQQRKVMVYQLVTRHTVEEKVVERARAKLVLEHLVVSRMKDEFKKGELDELLRYGAQQIFREDGDPGSVPPLVYDDEQIEKLLDRQGEGDGVAQASRDTAAAADGKYFGGFKTARVWETEVAASTAATAGTEEISSDGFWDTLLEARNTESMAGQKETLGKRARKEVKYADIGSDCEAEDDREYEDTSSGMRDDDDELGSDAIEDEEDRKERKSMERGALAQVHGHERRRHRKEKEKGKDKDKHHHHHHHHNHSKHTPSPAVSVSPSIPKRMSHPKPPKLARVVLQTPLPAAPGPVSLKWRDLAKPNRAEEVLIQCLIS